MKEPARSGNALLAETDFQWNTHLDMKMPSDKAMVDQKKE